MPRERKRSVRLKRGPYEEYPIAIRPGLLRELPRLIAERWGHSDLFVVTDTTVARLHGRNLLRGLHGANLSAIMIDVSPGERSKQIETVSRLHSALLSQGIRRDSLIVALGGGVVGDLAGFVAATVLRGVRYVQVPTTLLAQVDSSVGGKVGIDHPLGKNLIGAFCQPAAVFIDPEVLRTLPAEEYRNGLGEVVKIAASLDKRFFSLLEKNTGAIRKRNLVFLSRMIADAVGLKASVVETDEFETGLRKVLNAGHTIGHAIELSADFEIKHGAAVAMGLAAEARIAVRRGMLAGKDFQRLQRILSDLDLPVRIPRLRSMRRFQQALGHDKKADSGGVKFVLMDGIGSSVIGVPVREEEIAAAVEESR